MKQGVLVLQPAMNKVRSRHQLMPLTLTVPQKIIRGISILVLELLCMPALVFAENIRIGGTGSAMPMLEKLSELYRKTHPESQFTIINPPLGSGGAMRALASGKIDLAISCKQPASAEKSTLAQPIPWVSTPFALVGRDVKPGFNLSREQLVDIYALKTKQWQDGRPIRLVMRSANESDSLLLRGLSPQMDAAITQTLQSNVLPVTENDLDTLHLIETAPGSLGAVSLGLLRCSRSMLTPIGLDGVQPSVQAMQEGRYPLSKTLLLVTANKTNEATLAFVRFLRSAEVLSLLQAWDYVPAHP